MSSPHENVDKLGLAVKVNTIDEWLSGVRQNVVATARARSIKLDDWVILAVSSGTVRNGVSDSIKMELLSIPLRANIATHVDLVLLAGRRV